LVELVLVSPAGAADSLLEAFSLLGVDSFLLDPLLVAPFFLA